MSSNPGNFANRPKEEVVEAARKGGKASGHSRSDSGDTNEDQQGGSYDDNDSGNSGTGKQGFASMPKEKVQQIASQGGKKGGRSSGSGDADEAADDDDYVEEDA